MPSRKRNHSVGDLTILSTTQPADSSKSYTSPEKQHTKKAKTKVTKVTSNDIDGAINAVLSQPSPSPSTSVGGHNSSSGTAKSDEMTQLHSEISHLQSVVSSQSAEITRLTQQLSFVLSYLGITDPDHRVNDPVQQGDSTDSGEPTGGQPMSYSSAVKNGGILPSSSHPPTARSAAVTAAVTAIYVEQSIKKQRSSTFIVSGFPKDGSLPDKQRFIDLCSEQLNIQPDVVYTKRIGPVRPGRLQPLLVALRSEDAANRILDCARHLRRSTDNYIKHNVYINPNLTRAEAAAAYQIREHRRRLRKQISSASTSGPSTNVTAFHSTSVYDGRSISEGSGDSNNQGQSSILNPTAPSYHPTTPQ